MEMPGGSGAPSLARQGSVYSLTFDEFQSTLGGASKDFGSMNMDELLRSIWTAEETQAMASASAAGAGAGMPPTPLQRQGSSLTLPRTLSAKTVDEVWRNLVRDEPPQAQGADGGGHQQHHRQSTLGEMTLEEFLVRAGVVRENPAPAPPAPPPMNMMPPRPVPVAPKSSAFFGNLPGADDAAAAAALGFAPVGMGDLALIPPRAAAGMGGSAMAVYAHQ